MKKALLVAATFTLMSLVSAPMYADSFYSFSFAGTTATGSPATPFSGSGTFDAVVTATPGKYTIVGITGTTEGSVIASLTPKGGFFSNDNLLFVDASTGVASLDNGGVAYKLANGVNVSLFYGVPGQYQQETFGFTNQLISQAQTTPLTITPLAPVAATPEPDSIVLLGTGILGMAGMVRRRFTASVRT